MTSKKKATAENHEPGDEGVPGRVGKSIFLDLETVGRIEVIKEARGDRSFTATAEKLILEALASHAGAGSGGPVLALSDLPEALQRLLKKVAELKGKALESAIIDILWSSAEAALAEAQAAAKKIDDLLTRAGGEVLARGQPPKG